MNPFILSCWLRVRYISHGDSHCVGNWCLMSASFLVWRLIIEILDSLGPTSPFSCVILAMFHYLVLCSFVYKSRVIPAFPTSEGCCEVQMRVIQYFESSIVLNKHIIVLRFLKFSVFSFHRSKRQIFSNSWGLFWVGQSGLHRSRLLPYRTVDGTSTEAAGWRRGFYHW